MVLALPLWEPKATIGSAMRKVLIASLRHWGRSEERPNALAARTDAGVPLLAISTPDPLRQESQYAERPPSAGIIVLHVT